MNVEEIIRDGHEYVFFFLLFTQMDSGVELQNKCTLVKEKKACKYAVQKDKE